MKTRRLLLTLFGASLAIVYAAGLSLVAPGQHSATVRRGATGPLSQTGAANPAWPATCQRLAAKVSPGFESANARALRTGVSVVTLAPAAGLFRTGRRGGAFATGTRAVLSLSGRYPVSCCMTCPHSWAATPIAATEVEL